MSAPASLVVDAARTRLGQAQAAYATALSGGAGTAEARARLERAQDDLDAMQAQAGAEAEREESERRQQIQSAAAAEAKAAAQQVQARIQALATVSVPSIELPPGVVATLIEARQRAAAAADAAGAARAKVSHLMARQQALLTQRAEIVARRQAGSENDAKDGPALALIQADSDALSTLIEQAAADAAEPVRQAEAAAAAIGHAEQLWVRAVDAATTQALTEIAWELESALVRAASELYPRRLTGGTAWRPGRELAHLVGYGSPLRGVA